MGGVLQHTYPFQIIAYSGTLAGICETVSLVLVKDKTIDYVF